MSTTHRLTAAPVRYESDRASHHNLVQVARYGRLRIMFLYTDPAQESRRVFQGPKVQGPFMASFALASVIDNHGGTGAEAARNRAAGIEFDLADGDVLVMPDGAEFTVSPGPALSNGLPSLELAA